MPEVKVPELAESITEGTIAEWFEKRRGWRKKVKLLIRN